MLNFQEQTPVTMSPSWCCASATKASLSYFFGALLRLATSYNGVSTRREKGGVSVLLELLLRTRVFLLTQPATYQTLSSQSGKYGISTRHFASSLRVLNISRTSSFLFSSQVVLWWCSHIISIQRKYLSLSFISPP